MRSYPEARRPDLAEARVLAAHRAGLKTVILPKRNEPDLEDVPPDVRRDLGFVFAEDVRQVLEAALEDFHLKAKAKSDGRRAPAVRPPRAKPAATPARRR